MPNLLQIPGPAARLCGRDDVFFPHHLLTSITSITIPFSTQIDIASVPYRTLDLISDLFCRLSRTGTYDAVGHPFVG